MNDRIQKAADLIRNSSRTVAFTGAGISVESGIPPFRGPGGLWNKYDPKILDIGYFNQNPAEAWVVIKELFYDFMGNAGPNAAHIALAEMEKMGYLQAIIPQNIDNLHQKAGNTVVWEFHGNSRDLVCMGCGKKHKVAGLDLNLLPPKCDSCGSILKPDFVFFGEGIPEPAMSNSFAEAEKADVFILIGTTGEIMPASLIPFRAKEKGKKIIEINIAESNYTPIADVFLEGKATEMMTKLVEELKKTNHM
jgi:NAD-dependent deacetylase